MVGRKRRWQSRPVRHNAHRQHLLYIGDGKGGFVESAAAYNAQDASGDGSGVAVADFNNDGYQDLYLANTDADRLLKNNAGSGL